MRTMRLDGKVAVVTGSSRGIGRAIALAFAREGANVVVNYVKSRNKAEEVVSQIEAMGKRTVAIKADVSSINEVREMVDRCIDEFGRLDILVNNAADFSVMDFSLEKPDWKGWEQRLK